MRIWLDGGKAISPSYTLDFLILLSTAMVSHRINYVLELVLPDLHNIS